MTRKRTMLIVGGALVILIVAWSLHGHLAGVVVEVGVAERSGLTAPLSTDGVVEAIEVTLAPEASGTLMELYVDEGDKVSLGQVLARVTDEKAAAQVREAQAALDAAAAQVRIAAAELDVQRSESKATIGSADATVGLEAAQLDKARKGPRSEEIAQAQAAVRAAQADVKAAEAGVEAGRVALSQATDSSAAQIVAAEADVAAAEAQLAKAHAGARSQEIEQARAARDAAAAESDNMTRQYQRMQRLNAQGAAAKSDLDDAEAAMLSAKAAEKAASQALDVLLEGTRAEDIAAAQAQVDAARGHLAGAKAAGKMVDLRKKELAAAEAHLARSKAVLEESGKYAEMLRAGTREEDLRTQQQRLAVARAQRQAALASRSTVSAAGHRLQAAVAEQKRAGAALQTAQSHLFDTTVRSPITGVVAQKLAETGEIVGPQAPMLVLVNHADVWVTADVDDEDVGRVRMGQEVTVLCEAYPDRVFKGQVVRIGDAALPKGTGRVKAKIVRVKIQVANAAPLLKPGMAVDIEAEAKLKADALLVPADAVLEEAAGEYVYVVINGRVHKTVVETGFSNYTQTEILGGLSEGDVIVVSGKDDLHDGARVSVKQVKKGAGEGLEAGN